MIKLYLTPSTTLVLVLIATTITLYAYKIKNWGRTNVNKMGKVRKELEKVNMDLVELQTENNKSK